MAKGGGSANKSYLFQETKALLNPTSLLAFVDEKLDLLGTAACPPYHLAVVIGGTSAEFALKTAKLASTRYLDSLPLEGNELGRGFRDLELENEILKVTQESGIGAQFGGKYFCHDVRVIRLPRHGASCPVAIAVSCSADRQALGKITAEGVFLEQLEHDPARYLPEVTDDHLDDDAVQIDLNQPMDEIRAELSKLPVKTRLALTGPMIVARDIAHAKLKERLDAGEGLPQYLKDHCVYYAGPAKTPEGYASGSFGPTTAGRMDSYVDLFQQHGGSFVMLAKGNRSKAVTDACARHGGFYLGSIGGPAARLAQDCITQGRGARVPRARHGGGLEDRGARTSRPSSSSTTRATTSSKRSPGAVPSPCADPATSRRPVRPAPTSKDPESVARHRRRRHDGAYPRSAPGWNRSGGPRPPEVRPWEHGIVASVATEGHPCSRHASGGAPKGSTPGHTPVAGGRSMAPTPTVSCSPRTCGATATARSRSGPRPRPARGGSSTGRRRSGSDARRSGPSAGPSPSPTSTCEPVRVTGFVTRT